MPILLAANKCDLEKSDPSQVQVTREDIIKQVGVNENQVSLIAKIKRRHLYTSVVTS